MRAKAAAVTTDERGEDAGERSRSVLHAVGDDGQPERREAPGIAIGVDREALALRLEPGDDAGEDRAAADFTQRLVAAAHPAREAARKHHAWRATNISHHSRRLRAHNGPILLSTLGWILIEYEPMLARER